MEKRNNFKIVKYENNNISLDVRYDEYNRTIWLTQSEIAFVFETTKRNIGMHIKNIVGGKSGFLPETIEILVNNQTTKTYNLDVIEEICKHSKSAFSYDFINWANGLISMIIK